jgi:perosamine synthetase
MTTDRIPLARPDIREEDIEAIRVVLESGRLSQGPALAGFERAISQYVGVEQAAGVSSGTAALMLALDAVGVRAGDEVVTVSLSFVATANAIVRVGARPVFVDVGYDDLNIDPAKIEAALTSRTRAIVVVHLFGQLADMHAISEIAARHGVAVVEDACEALGARDDDGLAGSFGDIGVFGFYPNKPITTGEGGMIVSRSPELIETCRKMRNHGRGDDGAYRDPVAGFNFRLSELNAALGLTQLSRLPQALVTRNALATMYYEFLGSIPGLSLIPPTVGGRVCAWFTYPVRIPPRLATDRDAIRAELYDAGIETGDYFPPIHSLPYYRNAATADLSVTEAEAARLFSLPLYVGMSDDDTMRVAATLRRAIERRDRRRVEL